MWYKGGAVLGTAAGGGGRTLRLGYFGLGDEEKQLYSIRLSALSENAPLISVVIPVFNTDLHLLNACVLSIVDGVYPNWEMILVDDASTAAEVKEFLLRVAAEDTRIHAIFRSENGNISKATNDGVEKAQGEFIAFVDHDDELQPDALLCVAEAIISEPAIDVWYSDQWKCDENGQIYDHFFKPDWSPTYLLGVMYVGHLLTVRTSIVRKVGGFDSRFDGVQDFDFMLRISEQPAAIGHIPRALYKWRAVLGSLAAGVNEKSGIEEGQRKSVEQHLLRLHRSWQAVQHPTLPHRVLITPGPKTPLPKVSIIVPTKDQGHIVARCLDTLFELTDYPHFEVVIVDNGTTDPIAISAFERHPVVKVNYARKFNFSEACNLGAEASSGNILVFLNNDTEIIEAQWLRNLVVFFEDPGVGAVGPVLLYPDRRVQHAGVVIGARGTADHVHALLPGGS